MGHFGMWFRDLEGRVYGIDERNMTIKIEKQLTEVLDPRMAQMHVLAHAQVQETGSRVMAKIRYDLKPKDFGITDVERNKEIVERHVDWESDIMDLLYDIDHGPKRVCTIRYNQGPASVCPGGYIWITVLEQVPGEDVGKIKDELSDRQLRSIRKQLAYILTEMAKEDVTMGEQHPSFLRYDTKNDILYLVDVTHWSYHEIGKSIGMNSAYVMAFGLWNEPVPDDEAEEAAEEVVTTSEAPE